MTLPDPADPSLQTLCDSQAPGWAELVCNRSLCSREVRV
jgi:hypothetical protein